jgi:hypothetical protein
MFEQIGRAVGAPLRLIGRGFGQAGRAASLVLGFTAMVIGVAFLAGSQYWVGGPMFLFGLWLTLRCLG